MLSISQSDLFCNCSYSSKFLNNTSSNYEDSYSNQLNINSLSKYDEYTKKGIITHYLISSNLKKRSNQISEEEYIKRTSEIKNSKLFTEDIKDDVNFCIRYILNYISNIKSDKIEIQSEKYTIINELNLSGIIDCYIVHDNHLFLVDFKTGAGIDISARDNYQLILYSYSLLQQYKDINDVTLCIVQPRSLKEQISLFETDRDYINNIVDEKVRPALKNIQAGQLTKIYGTHCKNSMCSNYHNCSEVLNKINVNISSDITNLDNNEISDVYSSLIEFKHFIDNVESEIIRRLEDNQKINGVSLTIGKKHRTLQDSDEVLKRLIENGYDRDILTKTKSLTELEKILGSTIINDLLSDLIVHSRTKSRLVVNQ